MNCSEFRQNLNSYLDDLLAPEVRALCDEHLRSCPLCRVDLAETEDLISGLGGIKKAAISFDFQTSLRNSVAIELAARQQISQTKAARIPFRQRIWAEHFQPNFVPFATAACASLLFFALMFGSLMNSISTFRQMESQARVERERREVLLAASSSRPYESMTTLPAADYAVRRLDVAAESPSLNPQSAFVSLTASLTRNEADDESIMVVANVLSSGIAQISDVIESPREPSRIAELEKILHDDPAFVTSALDRRPENVRVVLLIQKVEVRGN